MSRQVLNLAAGLSLLLCVATVALWVEARLFGTGRRLFGHPPVRLEGWINGRILVWSVGNGLWVMAGASEPWAGRGTKFERWGMPGARLVRMSGRAWGYEAWVSYWLLALVFGVLPACRVAWLLRDRRRRAGMNGLCASCGYDVRATPEAGAALLSRCPECGTPVAPAGGGGAVECAVTATAT